MHILEQLDRLSSQVPPLVQHLSPAESLTSGSQVEEGDQHALLQGVTDLYQLVRRGLGGSDCHKGEVYRAAIFVDELAGVAHAGEYALLFVLAEWKQRAGWYALRVEPIQRALASGLVLTSPDGWCWGFAFCSNEAHRRCETIGDACRQIQGDVRSNPRNRK